MSDGHRYRFAVGLFAFVAGGALSATGCALYQQTPAATPPPVEVAPQLMPPALGTRQREPVPEAAAALSDTAREVHIDVDTHGADVDVRTLLDFIARSGNFTLVYSPGITKRVRVQLTDVPVSVALETVLSLAGLTLEAATPSTRAPGATSVVFYQLPVNVDSLSAEAIMRRFGVGRAVAETIVQSRTTKP